MHQVGIRSRAVAAITTALLCAGSLSGCAFLSRASEAGNDVQANADSYIPALSADGRWVAFWSQADNLVADDTNQLPDVFVRDNWTKAVSRVSVSSTGAESTGSLDPSVSISDDGRVVAFVGFSGDLVAADTNDRLDVIWHDRDTDQDGTYDEPGAIATELVSARPDGAAATGDSAAPVLNADGSVVAFQSDAPDLLAAPDHDTNAQSDIFATTFDLTTGQRTGTRIVSRSPGNPALEANDFSLLPSIDATGTIIAFETLATNLVSGDTNNDFDVLVNDGTQMRRGTGAVQANGRVRRAALSRDGTHIAYVSGATNLVPGDSFANDEVFVTDFAGTGVTLPARENWLGGTSTNSGIFIPSLNEDGSRVAYTSFDPGIVPFDTNGTADVFVHDFNVGATQRVSTNFALQQGTQGSGNFHLQSTALSADGNFVAFTTQSPDLLTPDSNGQQSDVVVRGAMVPVLESLVTIDPFTHLELPPILRPGANQLLIRGGGFGTDVDVMLGTGVTVTSTTEAGEQVLVSLTVAPGTPAEPRNVIVRNRGTGALFAGTVQICDACVTIAAN